MFYVLRIYDVHHVFTSPIPCACFYFLALFFTAVYIQFNLWMRTCSQFFFLSKFMLPTFRTARLCICMWSETLEQSACTSQTMAKYSQVQTVASKNGLVRVFGEWVVNLGRYSLWLVLMWLLIPYRCWHIVHSHWWYTVLVSLITIDKWCFFSFPFLSACLIALLVLLFSMPIVCMDFWCCVCEMMNMLVFFIFYFFHGHCLYGRLMLCYRWWTCSFF